MLVHDRLGRGGLVEKRCGDAAGSGADVMGAVAREEVLLPLRLLSLLVASCPGVAGCWCWQC